MDIKQTGLPCQEKNPVCTIQMHIRLYQQCQQRNGDDADQRAQQHTVRGQALVAAVHFRQVEDIGRAGRGGEHQHAGLEYRVQWQERHQQVAEQRKEDQLAQRDQVVERVAEDILHRHGRQPHAQDHHAERRRDRPQHRSRVLDRLGQPTVRARQIQDQTRDERQHRRVTDGGLERDELPVPRQVIHANGEHKHIHGGAEGHGVYCRFRVSRQQCPDDRQPEEAHIAHHGGDGQHPVAVLSLLFVKDARRDQHEQPLRGQRHKKEQSHPPQVILLMVQLQKGIRRHKRRASVHQQHAEAFQMLRLDLAPLLQYISRQQIDQRCGHIRQRHAETQHNKDSSPVSWSPSLR